MISSILRPIRYHKYLLWQLTQREIKARYKQSFLGYAWVLANPLAQMLVYSFVFSLVFRFPSNDIPYQVFLFSALLPWTFLQSSITASTQSLVNNAPLLKKVAFPREIIPYAVVISKMIDLIFSSLVFVGLIAFFNVKLASTAYIFIPLLAVQLMLTMGISLMLATFNLFYRDIQYLANLVLMIWMYMTPIVYPLSMVPDKYVKLYKLNPMVGIVEGYRSALFGYPFETTIIAWSVLVSSIVLLAGFVIFKRSEKVFADIV